MHNSWHLRHANPAMSSPFFNQLSLFNFPTDPNHSINVASQDWLGIPYSSHVNPYFWRLHGYVDDRVNGWLQANG